MGEFTGVSYILMKRDTAMRYGDSGFLEHLVTESFKHRFGDDATVLDYWVIGSRSVMQGMLVPLEDTGEGAEMVALMTPDDAMVVAVGPVHSTAPPTP